MAQKGRKIPPKVSHEVKTRHFFECAWDGTHLMDRHHIYEFAKGGKHTTENLILLCPNCHRQVHEGKISEAELIHRKSTHIEADRIQGGFTTTLKQLKLKAGGGYYTNTPNILVYKGETMLALCLENERLLLTVRLYNESGELSFWMRDNRYWAISSYAVKASKEYLEINNTEEKIYLKISRTDDYLNIMLNTYLGGKLINITQDDTTIPGVGFFKDITADSCYCVFNI